MAVVASLACNVLSKTVSQWEIMLENILVAACWLFLLLLLLLVAVLGFLLFVVVVGKKGNIVMAVELVDVQDG